MMVCCLLAVAVLLGVHVSVGDCRESSRDFPREFPRDKPTLLVISRNYQLLLAQPCLLKGDSIEGTKEFLQDHLQNMESHV